MKKLLSIIMTIVTTLMTTTVAMAAGTGSISIANAVEGKEYTIYRIFDLEDYDTQSNAYSYKINSVWGDWAKSQTAYVTVDELGYVKWNKDADVKSFAEEALSYAKNNKIANQGTKTAGSDTLTFTNLELGYYLVDSSLGALCSLDTTNPSVEIEEKNEQPTVIKEVEEDSTGVYGETNDADIDQIVNFRTTITVQAGAENYILHDKMSEGLTFGEISSITVNGTSVNSANYTFRDTVTDNCTFEIVFKDEYVSKLTPGTQIVVSYTANLNEKAIIAGAGNPNETWLSYGDNNNTTHDFTRTFTWYVDLFKYTKDGETKKSLSGAIFKLSKAEDGSEPIFLSKVDNSNVYMVDESVQTTTIETDNTGEITIKGLDEGIYYLHETKAPNGYNKLAGPAVIVITSSETGEENNKTKVFAVKVRDEQGKDTEVSVVEIENKTSVELPQTGDIGTKVFYLCGGIMFLCAATLLVVRKRMYEEE